MSKAIFNTNRGAIEVEFFDDTYMCGTIKHFYLDLPEGAPSPA